MAIPVWRFGICYFPAPKVANTSLKHAFHRIRTGEGFVGELRPDGTRTHIHQAYGTPLFTGVNHEPFANLLRMAVVRDPIDRLLSTWGNRVVFHRELSAEKTAQNEMTARGLAFDPDLNAFVDRLDDYVEMNKSVKVHASPLVEFLGPREDYFHALFDIRQIDKIESFLSILTGQRVKLPHKQAGGPKASRDDLTADQIKKLERRYQEDYEVYGEYFRGRGCGTRKSRPTGSVKDSASAV